MFKMMIIIKIIITTLVVVTVLAEDITSSVEKIDLMIDQFLQNEFKEHTDSVENSIEEENLAEPIYSNGTWQCGKCEDIDETRLVYTETYNIEANDVVDGFINLQVGLSMEKMSCVIVTTNIAGEVSIVTRLSGNCAGSGATLRVAGATQCDVKVYE